MLFSRVSSLRRWYPTFQYLPIYVREMGARILTAVSELVPGELGLNIDARSRFHFGFCATSKNEQSGWTRAHHESRPQNLVARLPQ